MGWANNDIAASDTIMIDRTNMKPTISETALSVSIKALMVNPPLFCYEPYPMIGSAAVDFSDNTYPTVPYSIDRDNHPVVRVQ